VRLSSLGQTHIWARWLGYTPCACCKLFLAQLLPMLGHNSSKPQSGRSTLQNLRLLMASTKRSQRCGSARLGSKRSGRAGRVPLLLQLSRSSQISHPRKCLIALSNSYVKGVPPSKASANGGLGPTSCSRSMAPRYLCQFKRPDTPRRPAYGSRCTVRRCRIQTHWGGSHDRHCRCGPDQHQGVCPYSFNLIRP
jgi:hypothetical protein